MTTATTKSELSGVCRAANQMFEERGSSAWIGASGRYGYTALDLYDGSNLTKTLCAGTKRECVQYLRAMMEALWLLEEPFRA